jgi:methionyl-tRNA formyltransferase
VRVVFMGTPEFAVPSLSALVSAGHEVSLVVTQPDRPKGRGRKVAMSAVKERALELNLAVYQPERVRTPEAAEAISAAKPDVIVVAAFGQILPKAVLDIPPKGCINVHASLLPRYRGAAPINWAIIRGEDVTGVTIMRMDAGMDTGDMLMVKEEDIRPEDTGGSLTKRLSGLGAGMIVEALGELEAGRLTAVRQDADKATYAPMLKKETGLIDWNKPAAEVERLARGLDPWPGAYTKHGGETLRVWRVEVTDNDTPGVSGEVIEAGRHGIAVVTGSGIAVITELQLGGGKRMKAADYLAGHRLTPGVRLGQ